MPVKKHTPETKARIAATRKAQEAAKRLALSAMYEKPYEEVTGEVLPADLSRHLLIDIRRDVYQGNFNSLTAARVEAVLQSTKTGTLKDWSDFCDSFCERDGQLQSLVMLRKSAVAGRKLTVEPRSDSDADKQVATFVQQKLNAIPNLRSVIHHLLGAVYTGVEVAEIDWYEDEETGEAYPMRVVPESLRKFAYDEYLELVINYPNCVANAERLCDHPGKFIVHTPQVKSVYPVLDGLFRSAAYLSFFKRKGLSFWVGGAERFAFPSLIITAPQNTDASIMDNIRADMQRMTQEQIAVLKAGVTVTQLNAGTAGGDLVWEKLETYLNDELAKLIVGGTLTTDHGANGSFAAARIHDKRFYELALGDAEKLAETLTAMLVKPILEMNAHLLPTTQPPILYFDGIEVFPELEEWHCKTNAFTINELRKGVGHVPWSRDKGGEDIVILADIAAAQTPEDTGDTAEPTDTGEAGDPTAPTPGAAPVASQALNGAQIQALQGIITAVTQKQLPAASAIEMIVNGFPTIDRATAEAMVNPAAAFTPATQEEASQP